MKDHDPDGRADDLAQGKKVTDRKGTCHIGSMAKEFQSKAKNAITQERRQEGLSRKKPLLQEKEEDQGEEKQVQSRLQGLDRKQAVLHTVGDAPADRNPIAAPRAHASDAIEGQFNQDTRGKEIHQAIETRLHDQGKQEEENRREVEDPIERIPSRPRDGFAKGGRILQIEHDLCPKDLQDDHHPAKEQGRIPSISIPFVDSNVFRKAEDDADAPEEDGGRDGKGTKGNLRQHPYALTQRFKEESNLTAVFCVVSVSLEQSASPVESVDEENLQYIPAKKIYCSPFSS